MFTGIIEALGTIKARKEIEKNVEFTIQSEISHELKVDQSISHNGVCLTVIEQEADWHKVTAIKETLDRSSLGSLAENQKVNLERCMKMDGRLDGHIVQGHVDGTGKIKSILSESGSWKVTITHSSECATLLVPKGSITIDGVSLTVVDCDLDSFSVAIIPYTWEHTIFHKYKVGDIVNLEYDIIGKYILRREELRT